MLGKIKSKNILDLVMKFIKDNKFFYKLIAYSKKDQLKYKISKNKYIDLFYDNLRLDINSYIHFNCNFFGKYTNIENFDKYLLLRNFKNDLLKYKFNIYQLAYYINCVYPKTIMDLIHNGSFVSYFDKNIQYNNEKEKEDFLARPIEIYSPFFFILSLVENFEDKYYIPISAYMINKFNLKDDYINAFNKLKQIQNSKNLNIHFFYINDNDINYLIDLNIFKKIKKLTLEPDNNELNDNVINYNNFFKKLFSPENINSNNLIYLKLKIDKNNRINPKLVENLNEFKLIEELYLSGFKFNETFYLKLKYLKSLKLSYCENISFDENSCNKLENLDLFYSKIVKSKSLLKFPELKSLIGNQIFKEIIDLKSLAKLERFIGESYDFIKLKKIH